MKIFNAFLLTALFLFSNQLFAKTNCRIIFDAGSSGTRLYVYERASGPNTWIEHEGPKVEALADPVREIRGKKWSNMQEVVQTIPKALDLIKTDSTNWKAFDWEKNCTIVSASVLATAGMRMAEQQEPEKSKVLWNNVKKALSQKIGNNVPVLARTLTGFEEGLYAWLSVYQLRKGQPNFGIAEMGGASAQVAFSCNKCPGSRQVLLDQGKSINFYSYSFLGLGGDVASEIFGVSPSCAYGAGESTPKWNEKMCAETINLKTSSGIKDPFNFNKGKKGTSVKIPLENVKSLDWYLTGALSLLGTQISADKCCLTKGPCYDPRTSCFRSVYFKKFLDDLGISSNSKKVSSSWTLGATICQENNCLKNAGQLTCIWSNKGCLEGK
jgi:GDA1/CD39 (nucleoside phosphatase) family